MTDSSPLGTGDQRSAGPLIRVLEPAEGVLAFYGGRDGRRFADVPNWVDDGALSLGIASYAVVNGADALVYDTGISPQWGEFVRGELQRRGVSHVRVVLSHHHLDHIAGTQAFADCEIIAGARTADILARSRAAIERGELEGPPAIAPLVMPNATFADHTTLTLGTGPSAVSVELLGFNIHSDDATVLWLPGQRLLLAGDTVEDPVTYVDEPHQFAAHLRDLAALAALAPLRILPNHGSPHRIASGGYPSALIDATSEYIAYLQSAGASRDASAHSLRDVLTTLASGSELEYFPAYERVHSQNLRVAANARPPSLS
jgi:cyclase